MEEYPIVFCRGLSCILSLKLLTILLRFNLILGGFYYCHYCLSFAFASSTIIITYSYRQMNKACGFFTIFKIWGLPTDCVQKWFLLIKTRDRLWDFLVYLNTIEQWPKNIVMIGKHWNNHYCYNRLSLENSIKITKTKIMRWEADKRWLHEWCNDYTTIKYQFAMTRKLE